MKLTDSQHTAVTQRGTNLLVAASAGSGKTEVLARRCVALIADSERPCGIDQLLVVTFTRAAAAELRTRVGQMLRAAAADTRDRRQREHLRRQEVLLEAADIGTIDAWCARVVRANFAATASGIDPAFTTLGEQQAALLRAAVLDELFEWVYTADDPLAEATREWIQRNARPSDDFLRTLVHALNRYREHLINPLQWFRRQLELYQRDEAELRADAEGMLAAALSDECGFQQDQLPGLIAQVQSPAVCAQLQTYRDALQGWSAQLTDTARIGSVVGGISAFKFPRKPRDIDAQDAALRQEVKERWFDKRLKKHWDAREIKSIPAQAGQTAELLVTLLRLEDRYRSILAARKDARGVCEFGDVLRLALDLLGEPTTGQRRTPTPIARALQQRYEHILVDEYQDTSPVQVELLRLVTRSEPGRSNRFMVGDVKQSIYGFREAEPRLFAELVAAFSQGREEGRVLPLSDNFRSHPDLLAGVNRLFALLFDPALGGTGYGSAERLQAGRLEIANPTLDGRPRIHVHLVSADAPGSGGTDDTDDDSGTVPLERIEREALVAARHIHTLVEGRVQIPERGSDGVPHLRPLRWGDIVILLRAAKGHAPLLAGALRAAGVPCVALGRESLLESVEVGDMRNALMLLANRRQDVPLAGYLRGPLVGLSAAQLLEIREESGGSDFCTAVKMYRTDGADPMLVGQLDAALTQLDRWAVAARTLEVPALLRQILRDTGLVCFARALPGGEHRVAMLRALESLAVDFTERGQHGVAEFVEYLDALAEEEIQPAVAATTGADVVRIMTIHAAKGLEFPVVFLLAAGTAFSRRPQRGNLRCDEQRGVGIQFYDGPARRRLASAAFAVNQQGAARRELEEQLRLLYVAATRAREQLVVVGHASDEGWNLLSERYAGQRAPAMPALISRLSAASTLEWVLMGVAAGRLHVPRGGEPAAAAVEVHRGVESTPETAPADREVKPAAADLSDEDRLWVTRGQNWIEQMPETALSRQPAVVSVSAVKQQARRESGEDVPRHFDLPQPLRVPAFAQVGAEDSLAVGDAYHRFMQIADLRLLGSAAEVRAQRDQLVADGQLSSREAGLLSVDDLVWFAGTEEGRLVARQADRCRREVPFTYALSGTGDGERTVLRGVIDCLLEGSEGLTILDYKTDCVRGELAWRQRVDGYRIQLQLYALAAADVFARKVTRTALVFLRERRVVSVPVEPVALESLLAQVGRCGERA